MVRLSRDETAEGALPHFCLRCGEPADLVQAQRLRWHSDWLYLSLILDIVPYFVLRFLLLRRCTIHAPLCRKHRYHWVWRRWCVRCASIFFLSCLGIGIWKVNTQPSVWGAIFTLAGIAGLGCCLVIAFVLHRTAIRASAIELDHITLEGVSPKFVLALQMEREKRGAKPAMERCSRCAIESQLIASFQRRGRRLYCPQCCETKDLGFLKKMLLFELGLAAFGLLLLIASIWAPADSRLRSCGWFVVNLVSIFPFGWLVIVPHEAGHALAAVLLRARVFGVWLGKGRTVATRRLGNVRVEFKILPCGGATLIGIPNLRYFRLKMFLIILAGPMVHVGLLAALALAIAPDRWFDGSFSEKLDLTQSFVLANIIVLVGNLLPFRVQTAMGPICSDGLQLLTLPFASRTQVRQMHAQYFAAEGVECFETEQYDRAIEWFERGLALYSDDFVNRINLGVAFHRSGQFERARREWLSVLTKADLDPMVRALVLNNVAAADVLIPKPDSDGTGVAGGLLAEADAFSSQAWQCVPWLKHIKGTRGAVLVALGRVDEGQPLLEQALQEHDEAHSRAYCACFLSLAAVKQGRSEEARLYIDMAQQLHPEVTKRCQTIFCASESAPEAVFRVPSPWARAIL